ncbi:MAG: hypothetical protein HC851_17625 [Acaryochloris sp. RU_4_1]|nr:hypothetical protein [Acaryochloris sp. RU_4_1]
MELTQALDFIEKLSLEKRGKSLKEAHKIAIQAAWEDIFYRDAISKYSSSTKPPSEIYLSNSAGKEIWDFLSHELGVKITKKNLRVQLVKLEQKGENTLNSPVSPRGHSVSELTFGNKLTDKPFFGYQEELDMGMKALKDSWSLLVTGVSGIGKSAYVAKLVANWAEAGSPFKYVLWKSIHYRPTISELISEWSQALNLENESTTDLIQYCSKNRCLIVLDQTEHMLGGDDDPLYLEYLSFLKRFVEEQNLSSLIVSSIKPFVELLDFQDTGHPVEHIELKGLSKEAAHSLLTSFELKDKNRWDGLIDKYRGNPRWLIDISRFCNEYFNGSIESYLTNQSTWIGTSFTNSSKRLLSIDHPLAQLQRNMLRFLGKQEDSISINSIISEIIKLGYTSSTSEVLKALDNLVSQYLVEKFHQNNLAYFRLSPVMKKYVKVDPDGLIAAPSL